MARIVDLLSQRSTACFVGREDELRTFARTLTQNPPAVSAFLVHGPGGVGKTALLAQMQALARQAGLACIHLDARSIEPSVPGLLKALAGTLGMPDTEAPLADILQAWHQVPRRLLLIDTFERISHLEDWLRDHLLAELPQQSLVVISGRDKPGERWQTDPHWSHGHRLIPLRNLSPAHSEHVLAGKNLSEAQRQAIMRLSHGHPLTLMLMADLVVAHGTVPDALDADVIRRLTECFTAQAPSPRHKEALEFCAHARVTTEDLLAATVDARLAASLFDWLASLSFMEWSPEGLFPHDLVRDAIAADMRWRHPQRTLQGAGKLLAHYLRQAQGPNATLRAQAALDIFYLNRAHPVMHRFVDFAALGSVSCQRADAHDMARVIELVRLELGPDHAALAHRWHGHPAATWWVVREADGDIPAAMLSLDVGRMSQAEQSGEPVLAQLHRWMTRHTPLEPGQQLLCNRMSVVRSDAPHAATCINAMQIKNFSMWVTEPALALVALTTPDIDFWRPMMSHIDFHLIDEPAPEVDGRQQGTFVHDWRTTPLTTWLGLMGSGDTAPTPKLAEPDFVAAVHDALKHWHDTAQLGLNPLMQSRLARSDRRPDESTQDSLRRAILLTAKSLSSHPRQAKFIRAVELTYWQPVGSQELAAERLGLPFGTYRYQLRTAIARLAASLYLRENDEGDTPTSALN